VRIKKKRLGMVKEEFSFFYWLGGKKEHKPTETTKGGNNEMYSHLGWKMKGEQKKGGGREWEGQARKKEKKETPIMTEKREEVQNYHALVL